MTRKAPAKLGAKARRLWSEVAGSYELRGDEFVVLEDACREVDLIDRLEAELASGSLMVTGSQGQPVVNPIVAEIRQHRGVLSRLLSSLKLTDSPSEGERSASARATAEARWKRGA
jgi:hypothetical protein